jgi:hypothetical protein
MSQRPSGYERKPDESYETIAWPVVALLSQLSDIKLAWDPCHGSGCLVATLHRQGIDAVGTSEDFFSIAAPSGVTDIITNPPYGANRRGEEAERFIERALSFSTVKRIAMLLRNDFDSAIGRQHLFRNNSMFAGKVVLLGRIKWFAGSSSPSDNHAWFLFDRKHVGPPIIRYITKREAESRKAKADDKKLGLTFRRNQENSRRTLSASKREQRRRQ